MCSLTGLGVLTFCAACCEVYFARPTRDDPFHLVSVLRLLLRLRMFYETRQPADSPKKRLSLHLQKYIHWTGRNMKLMARRVERAWEYGAFQKYFDEKYPTLTDSRGRSACETLDLAAAACTLLGFSGTRCLL